MGNFNTFIIPGAIYCPYCGCEHDSVQTKIIGDELENYKIGDKVNTHGYGENLILVEQLLGCCNYKEHDNNYSKLQSHLSYYGISNYFHVYIVIENGIYKAITPDYESIEYIIDGEIEDFEFEKG